MLAGKSCELSSFSLSQQVLLRKLCREVYQMFRYGDRKILVVFPIGGLRLKHSNGAPR